MTWRDDETRTCLLANSLWLDRPFLFCVTTGSDLPLFVGVVNNPR